MRVEKKAMNDGKRESGGGRDVGEAERNEERRKMRKGGRPGGRGGREGGREE